ncbi:MAG: hypothetical protein OXF27_00215 [Acidobacteria bacterium]|nr:hypothetical protein [Acidobacteriota bacterium]
MGLFQVTFRDGIVQYVEAARVTMSRNMGLRMFTADGDTLIEAFAERKVTTIEVALDEEPLVPRPAIRSG